MRKIADIVKDTKQGNWRDYALNAERVLLAKIMLGVKLALGNIILAAVNHTTKT